MKTTLDEVEALAAEYVLGTLDSAERIEVAARRQREPLLEECIQQWEQRLSPLAAYQDDVAPPEEVLSLLEEKLDLMTSPTGAKADPAVVELSQLRQKLARWRSAAMAASAVAAALAAVLVFRPPEPVPEQPFVAVFQQDDQQPSFIMTVDLKTKNLLIKPIKAARLSSDKTYELWIKDDSLGPVPKSLGLIGSAEAEVRKRLDQFDPALLQKATFGISLEPEGGSPTGTPTGPAIHGFLYPTAI